MRQNTPSAILTYALILAAGRGFETASEARELFAKTITRAEIAEAQRLSREWRPKEKSQ